jgi:hypothetical protein
MNVCMGALAVYDYLLILDDEVCQSYPGVQRYIKLAQDILRLAGKESWSRYPIRDITALD